MNDIVPIIVSLSISGSFMAVLLFLGKPIIKKHVSKACVYYIWILVLLRLIIPISMSQSIVNQLYHNISSKPLTKSIPVNNTVIPSTFDYFNNSKGIDVTLKGDQSRESMKENNQVNTVGKSNDAISFKGMIAILWIIGSSITLMYCVIPYIHLKLRIRNTSTNPDPEDITIFCRFAGHKKIRLKCNSYITTPMLIGVISPCIVIPDGNYVKSGKQQELEHILCHELMHYQRKDLIYKWFTVIVTSLHWFNPLMIPIRRQISRSCELSCDEAIIKNMNATQKQSYGETLLSMATKNNISTGTLATTLCEGKKELKERLVGIMKYKKRTSRMIALSTMLVVLLTGCGTMLGSVSASEDTPNSSTQDGNINSITLPMATVGSWATSQEIAVPSTSESANSTSNRESDTINPETDTINPETDTINTDTEKVEDIADEIIIKYLDSVSGKLLKQTTDGFAKAYFTNNEEEMKKYLSKDCIKLKQEDGTLGRGKNEYDKLTHLLAKWYCATDEKAEVQYEYQIEGNDSYTYLGIALEYSNGQFLVTDFYLEK